MSIPVLVVVVDVDVVVVVYCRRRRCSLRSLSRSRSRRSQALLRIASSKLRVFLCGRGQIPPMDMLVTDYRSVTRDESNTSNYRTRERVLYRLEHCVNNL